jgi:hypothetical protein
MQTMHEEGRRPRAGRRGGGHGDGSIPDLPQIHRGLRGVLQRWQLGRLARRSAAIPHTGATEDERHVATIVRQTEAHVTARHRTDADLAAAEAVLTTATTALAEATNVVGEVERRTADALLAATGLSPHDPAHQVGWTAGSRARSERRAAGDAQIAARRALADATQGYETASRGAIDADLVAAETGIALAGAYLDRYNAACAGRGRPGIGVLGREVAEDIVLRAIRPLDLNQEPARSRSTRERGTELTRPRPGTAHLHVA